MRRPRCRASQIEAGEAFDRRQRIGRGGDEHGAFAPGARGARASAVAAPPSECPITAAAGPKWWPTASRWQVKSGRVVCVPPLRAVRGLVEGHHGVAGVPQRRHPRRERVPWLDQPCANST